jgi:hypothetical protein
MHSPIKPAGARASATVRSVKKDVRKIASISVRKIAPQMSRSSARRPHTTVRKQSIGTVPMVALDNGTKVGVVPILTVCRRQK